MRGYISYVFPENPPPVSDTFARDEIDGIMNEITRKFFGYILVTCPNCGEIHRAYDKTDDDEKSYEPPFIECECGLNFTHDEAPDLFIQ